MGAVGNCVRNGGFFTDEIRTDGDIFRQFIKDLSSHLCDNLQNVKPWILLVSEPQILTLDFRTTIPATNRR